MRKIINIILFVFFITAPFSAFAILSLELTKGVAGAIPIAVVPFSIEEANRDISQVVADDLQHSGRFKVFGRSVLKVFPNNPKDVSTEYFQRLGTNNVVVGKIDPIAGDHYKVSFQLLDIYKPKGAESIIL